MKKRLFTTLLLLCLLLSALTVMVSATPSQRSVTSPDDRLITLTLDGTYHCIWSSHTPKMQDTQIIKVNSWTQDSISLSVSVGTIQCDYPNGIYFHQAVKTDQTLIFSGSDLCHKKLDLTASLEHISFFEVNKYDWISYTLTSDQPYYQLIEHKESASTCTAYGYTQLCYECPECGAFFSDADAKNRIDVASVRIEKLPHTYGTDGSCEKCSYKAEAYIENSGARTYYDTAEKAAAASASDKVAHVFHFAREGEAGDKIVTLDTNVWLSVDTGIEIPELRLADSAKTVSILNSGSIGTISPASTGAQNVTIQNSGAISKIGIPSNGSLHMEITNNKNASITDIRMDEARDVAGLSVSIRNNGTIGHLYAYSDTEKPVKLQSGTGTYAVVENSHRSLYNRNFLADGCKYYASSDRKWYGTESTIGTYRNVIVSAPPFSVTVTGDGIQSGENGYSLTLEQKNITEDQKPTASVSFENLTGLNSTGAKFTYAWYYTGESKPAWTTETLSLNNLAVGTNNLTLCVTDGKYGYTQSVNVTVTITAEGLTPISLTKPAGTVTKMYDGTNAIPSDLSITFVDSNGNPVQLTKDIDYEIVTAEYNSPDCSKAEQVTVRVKLKGDKATQYSLTVSHFTVPGTITKFKPEDNYLFLEFYHDGAVEVNVGDSIIDTLLKKFTINVTWKYEDLSLPNPMNATPQPKLTFYHMRAYNAYDPTTDEKLTEDSVFTYVTPQKGTYDSEYYYFYAVVEETENYEELFISSSRVTVSSGNTHEHCAYGRTDCTEHELLTYEAFTGSSLTVTGGSLKKYLNANRSTVNLDLLLSKPASNKSEKAELSLCLFGKTLRADSSYTKQFRVTNQSYLALSDCVGTGTLMGTSVTDEYGGCLYVADATAELYHIKVTGGSSSKLGGAIVVGDKGILNIYDGEISGNTVTGGNGGAIYIKSGGTVNLYGGTIKNNHVYSGNGGAIYVAAGATLNLCGGTITGNTASGLGGGIYVEKGGTLNIKGNPVVTGNTAGSKDSNVYLAGVQILTADELGSDAKIGISVEALSYPALFAKSTEDYSTNFIPDDTDTFVLRSNGGLTLAVKPSAALNGTELTVTTGDKYAPDAFVLFVAEYGTDGRMLAVRSQTVDPGKAAYTFTVQNPGAKLKCFLLRKDTCTPLFEAFTFN